jgi:hypothetical protein
MIRKLQIGMSGPDVLAVQQGLNVWGASIAEDGAFGNETDGAVRAYQEENDLDVDGIVGPITRHSLFPTVVMTSAVMANVLRFPKIGSLRRPAFSAPALQTRFGGLRMTTAAGDSGDSPDIPTDIISQLFPATSIFTPATFPGLGTPLPAPLLPSPFLTLGFKFDHCEIAPGSQHTFGFTRSRQDAFVLTGQCIGTRGPADSAHEELTFGVQLGQPLNATDANGNAWTFNPFVQITDVDRFGQLGLFHFWQPYAQAGFQAAGTGPLTPTLTAQFFPLNLGFDIGRHLTLTAGAGVFANYTMDDNRLLLGGQVTFGANFKIFSLPGLF